MKHLSFPDLHHAGGYAPHEVAVVAGEYHRPLEFHQGVSKRFHGIHIQVVARFVQDQHIAFAQQQAGHA